MHLRRRSGIIAFNSTRKGLTAIVQYMYTYIPLRQYEPSNARQEPGSDIRFYFDTRLLEHY
jgi:hypothetical protein